MESTTHRPGGLLARLDAAFFVFAGLAAAWLAYLILREGIRPGWPLLLVVVFWALVAYLVLPRLHRILTRIYLPDYFIGRTRTSDGLLGDPVNLAVRGTESQLHRAMVAAGWTRADDLSFATGWRIITSTLTRHSYVAAPVSPLSLFGRQQDFAHQQEVAGSPSQRHHVRFWKCPPGWLLPGGFRVDWLAAGTYDRRVGLSLFTLQVTHKIDEDIDRERDHVVATVTAANPSTDVDVIENFSTGYHSRNGGGDVIETDGDLPVLDLSGLDAGTDVVLAPPAAMRRRPAQTVFGASVAGLRGLSYLALAGLTAAAPGAYAPGPEVAALDWALPVGYAFGGLADLGLAAAVLVGRNWARIVLCSVSVASVVMAYLANASGSALIALRTNLPAVAISVLVLLALSSQSARSFAERPRQALAVSPPQS